MIRRKDYSMEVVRVTPKMAGEWLANKSVTNRRLKVTLVARFARDMKNGNWELNGSTIVFDQDGVLLDGQHRLQACIDSKTAFHSLVVFGVKSSAFDTVDTGKTRSTADVFTIHGIPNAILTAAICALIWRRDTLGNFMRVGLPSVPTTRELELVQAQYADLIQRAIHTTRPCKRLAPPSLLSALYVFFAEKDQDTADLFFQALAAGDGLRSNDPIYLLRERLILDRTSKSRLPKKEIAALIVKAWNYVRNGVSVKQLKWLGTGKGKEGFPEIE